jgi:NADH-quinone oxidoreductase subunit J
MNPYDILFYLFAAATLLSGFLVVANPFNRNPVTSAMFLVVTIVSLAGLFVLLHAFFLAAVQIIVYAGAVMVLFLFVVMLLDLKEEERREIHLLRLTTGLLAVGGLTAVLLAALLRSSAAGAAASNMPEGQAADLGRILFSHYLLPFELLSVLLLVAMVGVILLSKKELK